MGKITDIEIQKRNKKRVNIYEDGQYLFACDCELVYTHKLKIGLQIDYSQLQSVVEEDNYLKAKTDALRVIERAYKTEKQIMDKLIAKGYEESVIERVMFFLREYDFVNDDKYAAMFVKSKILKEGKKKIYFNLCSKGVDEELIRAHLEDVDFDLEYDSAVKVAQKKYVALQKKTEEKFKNAYKLKQYLFSKGYSQEVIQKAVKDTMCDEEIY